MSAALRQLCILSVLCGAVTSLMPEGGVKRVAAIVAPCVLIIAIITPFKDFDYAAYAEGMAKYRKMRNELDARSLELNKNLNRLVIEEECEAYIMDKAVEKGVDLHDVNVSVEWSAEGCWVPHAAELYGTETSTGRDGLEAAISAELGIPPERQEWR